MGLQFDNKIHAMLCSNTIQSLAGYVQLYNIPGPLVYTGTAQTLYTVFRNSTQLSRTEKEFHVAPFLVPVSA